MTPDEFRAGRIALGLTHKQLAAILDRDITTVQRWQADGDYARKPDPTAARVLRWMMDGYRPPEWPAEKENDQ